MNLTSPRAHAAVIVSFLMAFLLVGGRLLVNYLPDSSKDPSLLITPPFNAGKEARISEAASQLLNGLGQEFSLDKRFEKNLFVEWQPAARVDISLRLDSVIIEGPPVFYQGLMQDEDGTMIAQINLEGRRSYFVSEGESVQGWKVMKISPEAVEVTEPSGKVTTYPYRGGEDLKKRKFYAVIMMEPDKKSFNVKEGDYLSDYKVTQVKEDSVVLEKDGTPLTLRTGSPGVVIDRTELMLQKESNEKSESAPVAA